MNQLKKKMLYFECYSGISGDMTVAALLDLGADEKELIRQLETLPLEGFRTKISRVKKSGLDCCDFHVALEEPYENHDHDMEYLYGHEHCHDHHEHEHSHNHYEHEHCHDNHEHEHFHDHHEHCHDHEHSHSHHDHGDGHEHSHNHHEHEHSHSHDHRTLQDVLAVIEHSKLTDRAKKIAGDIFHVLAAAEAKAHGASIEQVHFHEVGAVDSIVDIAAAAICLDNLDVDGIVIPELYEGKGTVRCAHGILPVPVPAVMNIAAEHNLILHKTNVQGELVTPTGAAIAAAVRTTDSLPPRYRILKTGMGAGKREYERASILRAMLIEEAESSEEQVYKLESNIDDCTGEILGYVMERLLKEGARDVSYTPIFMKKNRPAYQINIICTGEKIPAMEEILFQETTTIGIRRIRLERTTLDREIRTFESTWGKAAVKVCDVCGEYRIYPEYESAAAIARESGRPYREVWNQLMREAREALGVEDGGL